jgi:crossover junction endodeoxyribonuclease RuvC
MSRASNTISLQDFARLTGRSGRAAPVAVHPAATGPTPFRVLGVDTALRRTGYCVVESNAGRLRAVEYGAVASPASAPTTACLKLLGKTISDLLCRAKPDAVAIEGIFFSRNVKTTVTLGEARGVVLFACAMAGLPVYEYPPRRVKQAVVGFGAAEKQQVARMVASMLGLPRPPQADAADAIAIAICHLHNRAQHAMLAADPL